MEFPVLDPKATGARIKELRKERHLKVEDISRFMGFETDQAVYKWQRGDSLPTLDNLYALSGLFGIPVDDILRGSREESESSLLPFLSSVRRSWRLQVFSVGKSAVPIPPVYCAAELLVIS